MFRLRLIVVSSQKCSIGRAIRLNHKTLQANYSEVHAFDNLQANIYLFVL